MLDVLSGLMDGGSIELLSIDEAVLAVLKLSNPATQKAIDGRLEFNAIADEDAAPGQGVAASARIMGSDGGLVFGCDVGDVNSDAVIKLNPIKIMRGVPVRLHSFQLVMP